MWGITTLFQKKIQIKKLNLLVNNDISSIIADLPSRKLGKSNLEFLKVISPYVRIIQGFKRNNQIKEELISGTLMKNKR